MAECGIAVCSSTRDRSLSFSASIRLARADCEVGEETSLRCACTAAFVFLVSPCKDEGDAPFLNASFDAKKASVSALSVPSGACVLGECDRSSLFIRALSDPILEVGDASLKPLRRGDVEVLAMLL